VFAEAQGRRPNSSQAHQCRRQGYHRTDGCRCPANVASQWLARGTNTGPLADDIPPTDRSVTVPGASFTQVEGDKIRSEQAYHDRQTIDEQLGLKATKG
jgi:hypothetical protein